LSTKSYPIYAALDQAAAKVNCSDLVKARCLVADLRIRGAKTAEPASNRAADKEVAIGVHVKRSGTCRVRKIDRTHPGEATIGGAGEFPGVTSAEAGPKLILKPVSRAIGSIDGEPFLIASMTRSALRPGLAAVGRAPDVIAKE